MCIRDRYIEDGRTQQALADTVGADKAGAARALARLETDGYIRRVADPRDRRVVRAFLRPVSYTHLRAHETVLDLV